MSRLFVLLTMLVVVGLITFGCGGDAVPPVDPGIGDGPGPVADPPPQEPAGGVDTTAADGAPKANDPDPDDVQVGALNLLDGFPDNPPGTQQEMQDFVDALTAFVVANPNDAAAQLGLAIATGMAGMFNMALDLGVPPEDVFDFFPDFFAMFPTQAKGPEKALDIDYQEMLMRPIELMTGLYFAGPKALSGPAGAKAVIPGLEAEGITTEAVQEAIRDYLLPALYSSIERAEAVADNADPADAPIIEIGAGPDWSLYPSDVKMVLSMMHAFRAFLHELIAYQLSWDTYDWDVDWGTLDVNGDGLLSVAEYAPEDPFLWLHPAPNMQAAGDAVRASITCLIWGVQNQGVGSWWGYILDASPQTAAETITWLRDLRRLLTEQVIVQVDYDTKATANVPLNLGAMYYNPVDDIKDLFPTMHLVCDLGECWGEVNDENDYPDPTFHGIFPNPLPISAILDTDPNEMTITYNDVVIPIMDPDGFGFPGL